jgi:hypothetical protein
VTIYEPNPQVRPTGAEIDEFVDAPEPQPSEPPPPPSDGGAAPDDDGDADPSHA